MTNSEAIKILQDTPIDVASTKQGILGLYAEALNMAIEALQKQVTAKLKNPDFSLITEASINSNEQKSKLDLISRQDAIDAIKKEEQKEYSDWNENDDEGSFGAMNAFSRSIAIMRDLPSAQPESRCNTCRYTNLEWYEEPCDSCTMGGESNHYKPSAQRTGEWIMHLDDLFPAESTMECSQCHKHQPITIDNNFCPNCGADMRGGDTNDND